MQAVKFKLYGKTGFLKKPDVNVNTYFTYNNIHKVALLGVLGAIIGLGGHIQQNQIFNDNKKSNNLEYPDFYMKLKDLKVSIIPQARAGYFTKKIQVFNNTVGYASKEKGRNLVVREQWLENPSWEIYLMDDNSIMKDIFQKLQYNLINKRCVFMPYIGKNDHPVTIDNCGTVELEKANEFGHVDSLYISDMVKLGKRGSSDGKPRFLFKEISPYSLSKNFNFYEFKELCFTNARVSEIYRNKDVYKSDSRILVFI